MQAYMQHLYRVTRDLPEDVLAYIRPQTQQDRDFYNVLQRNQIPFVEFRKRFYLHARHVRESCFDGYIRDYLPEYFSTQTEVPKI